MKNLRVLGWILAGLAVLLLVITGVLLLPSVQRSLAERALRDQVPGEVRLAALKVRTGSVSLEGLALGLGAGHLEVGSANARFSLASVLKGKPQINSLEVSGMVFDLTRPDPRHKPEPLKGVVSEIPPLPFELAKVDVRGRIILEADRSLDVHLTGGGFTDGRTGQFALDANLGGAQPVRGALNIDLIPGPAGEVAGLGLRGSLHGESQPQRVQLDIDARFDRDRREERAQISLARPGAEPFLQMNGGVSAAVVAGDFRLTVGAAEMDVVTRLLGRELPEIEATGSGNFRLDRTREHLQTDLNLALESRGLDRLTPALAELPELRAMADLALAYDHTAGEASLERLALEANASGHPFAFALRLRQPLAWTVATGPGGLPAGNLIDLSMRELPLSWLAPGRATGTVRSVHLRASTADQELRIDAVEPLQLVLESLLAPASGALLSGLNLDLAPTLRWSPGELTFEIPDLRIEDSTGATVARLTATARGSGEQPLADLALELQATSHLAPLSRQPLGAGLQLPPADDLQVDLALTARRQGQAVRITEAHAGMRGAEERQPWLQARLAAPLTLNPGAPDLLSQLPARLLELSFNDLPLNLAQPYLEGDLTIEAGTLGGTVVAGRTSEGRYRMETTRSLSLRGVSVSDSSGILVEGLGIELAPRLEVDSSSIQVSPFEIAWSLNAVPWLQQTLALAAANGEWTLETRGTLDAAAAAPLMAIHLEEPVSAGTVSFNLRADGPPREGASGLLPISADLHLERLVLASGASLPETRIQAGIRPEPDRNGTWQAHADLRVEQAGRTSQVRTTAVLATAPKPTIAATLTSPHIHLPDLQALKALAMKPRAAPATAHPPAAPSSPPPALPASAPTTPIWAPWTGTLNADLTRVELAAAPSLATASTLTSVRLRARITEPAIEVDEVSAMLGGQPVRLDSALTFAADRPQPYELAGNLRLERMELVALAPPKGRNQPFLEGQVSLNGSFASRAIRPEDLLGELRFELRGDGSEGRIRPLAGAAASDPRLGLATALGGLLGPRGGSTPAAAGILPKVMDLFTEIPYQRFSFHIQRREGPVELSLFELHSNDIRLSSSARINWTTGQPFNVQPFEIPVRLAVRGRAAYLLDQGALLTGRQLGDGWYEGPTYVQGGTLSEPRSNLRDILTRALIGSLSGRRLGLADPDAPPPLQEPTP